MRIFTTLLVAAVLPAACKSGMQSPSVPFRMKDHEKESVAIRDAVARGDLGGAKREAANLALLPVDDSVATAWRQKLDAMIVAASRVAGAADLKDASAGLGPLARTCGDCHAMLGRPGPAVSEPAAGQASGVAPYMVRHEWAVSQMWDGLAIPSEDAWKAGAQALSEAPLSPETLTPGKTPVPGVEALEQSVHDLGRQAQATGKVAARARLFGDVMATCGECHQWLGGGPDGGPR